MNNEGFLNQKIDYKINNINNLKPILALQPNKEWRNYDVILCEPISLKNQKFLLFRMTLV